MFHGRDRTPEEEEYRRQLGTAIWISLCSMFAALFIFIVWITWWQNSIYGMHTVTSSEHCMFNMDVNLGSRSLLSATDSQSQADRQQGANSQEGSQISIPVPSGNTPPGSPGQGRRDIAVQIEPQIRGSSPSAASIDESTVIFKGETAFSVLYPWTVTVGLYRWPGTWLRWRKSNQIPLTHCTGALIRPGWVLTTAHCVPSPFHYYYVTAGTDCRPEFGGLQMNTIQVRRARRVHRLKHYGIRWSTKEWMPKFKSPLYRDDLALIQLEEDFDTTRPDALVRTIDLDDDQVDNYRAPDMMTMVAIGWGATENFNFPQFMGAVNYQGRPPIRTRAQRTALPAEFTEDCTFQLICIKVGYNAPSTARGDSGGPLLAFRRTEDAQDVDNQEAQSIRSSQLDDLSLRSSQLGVPVVTDREWVLVGITVGGVNFTSLNRPHDPPTGSPSVPRSQPQNEDFRDEESDIVASRVATPPLLGVRHGAGSFDVALYVRVRSQIAWISNTINPPEPRSIWRRFMDLLHSYDRDVETD